MDTDRLIEELQSTSDTNVFVMMRYRSAGEYRLIEDAIREALAQFGLTARLAKDRALVEDLWRNVELYMLHSRYGVAVFEVIDEHEFNPNISLELGYMYALRRRCLLLKDRRMPRVPTDVGGRIYRDFDALDLPASVSRQVSEWCERDLGMTRLGQVGPTKALGETLVFDSAADDPDFRTWGAFSSDGAFGRHIRVSHPDNGSKPALEIMADSSESVGVNKSFDHLSGQIRFEYRAERSGAQNLNLVFCMIPMQDGNGRTELLEVGATQPADPLNANSPYRERYFVPHSEIGDGHWHSAEIRFDFRRTPTAVYSIFAPRVNEGCPRPGEGSILVRSVQLLVPSS